MRKGSDVGKTVLGNQPYGFPSTIGTYGTNIVNLGALFPGDESPFPDNDLNNAISKPFIVTRMKFFVGRVAGGDEVDSDYDEVLVRIEGTSLDMKYLRNPAPLSVLLNRFSREWLLVGTFILGKQNGGASILVSCRQGSRGAPFNVSVQLHGYLQAMVPVEESHLPSGAPA